MKSLITGIVVLMSTISTYALDKKESNSRDQVALSEVTADHSAKEVQASKFITVYTDKLNGLSWSKALPGTYSNGCASNSAYDPLKCTFDVVGGSRQVRVEDSEAAKACREIGARLPTKEEFESLIRNFDIKQYSLGLTDNGVAQMQVIFGDMNNWFWSASVSSSIPDFAFAFDGGLGNGGIGYGSRYENGAVRCVSDR